MTEPSREAARKRFFSDYQFWLSADMPGSVWNEVRDFITDTVIPHTIEECQRAIAAAEERARAEQAETISAQAAEIERLKAGGCARDQGLTQFCAEAVALQGETDNYRIAIRQLLIAGEQALDAGFKEMLCQADIDDWTVASREANELLQKGQPQ
jgi:hypothetical protein